MRDTMQVATRDTMQDVFWFYNTDDWFYRYELYEQGVDMSRNSWCTIMEVLSTRNSLVI